LLNLFLSLGVKCVLWNVDPEDWKDRTPQAIADSWAAGAKPGAILLAHDIHERTIQSMDSALRQIKAKGFEMVTVKDLLNFK
jgi:peptidoglycan/xylan/chitin deacetylase (PgdA/CDA1 family)